MKIIKEYKHTGTGYNPYLITGQWQVAKLNWLDGHSLDQMDNMEVHRKTDEVFILLCGTAVLIASSQSDGKGLFEVIKMELGIIYNIPEGVWHNIAMEPDAQIIIVENSNTHLNDVEYTSLDNDIYCGLKQQINETV